MIDIATSTHLRGRFKTTYPKNIDAMLLCFVFQQGVEAVDGNVLQRLCKMMVFIHVACRKCFKTDGVMLRNKFMCNLVEKIVPLIRNSFMRPCKFEPCLLPVLRVFGFFGKGTLQTLDFLDGAFQVFVVLYLRTVRKTGKRLETQVYAYSFVFADWFWLCILFVHFYKYGTEIFVSRSPCDNGCLDTPFKLSMEASLDTLFKLGDIDLSFIVIHSCVLRNGKTLPIV